MRTAERSVRDRLTAGHRQRLRVSSAALGTAVARQARLDDVAQAAQEEALQAGKADGQIAKKQQELQLKLHEQAKVLYGEEYARQAMAVRIQACARGRRVRDTYVYWYMWLYLPRLYLPWLYLPRLYLPWLYLPWLYLPRLYSLWLCSLGARGHGHAAVPATAATGAAAAALTLALTLAPTPTQSLTLTLTLT